MIDATAGMYRELQWIADRRTAEIEGLQQKRLGNALAFDFDR